MESLNDYEVQEITRPQYKALAEIVSKNKHSLPFLEEKLNEYTKSIPNITSWEFTKYLNEDKVKVMTKDSTYYFKLNSVKKSVAPNEL